LLLTSIPEIEFQSLSRDNHHSDVGSLDAVNPILSCFNPSVGITIILTVLLAHHDQKRAIGFQSLSRDNHHSDQILVPRDDGRLAGFNPSVGITIILTGRC